MHSKKFLIVAVLGLIVFAQGCATLREAGKGAKEGFKEDWDAAGRIDDWMREHMW